MKIVKLCLAVILFLFGSELFAHGVDDNTKAFLVDLDGPAIIPFLYIGAKHMVTGYDHLLFLVGVIFFLFRPKDVLLYVSFFTLGHSLTLLFGVLNNVQVNPYIIDTIIGFSIVYKGFDNFGGFQRFFNVGPNTKIAVLIFGLFHGFGLATKLQELQLPTNGLWQNLLAFNIGVELGQFIALAFILIIISYWRRHKSFMTFANLANTLLMSGGFMLMGYQLSGYFTTA